MGLCCDLVNLGGCFVGCGSLRGGIVELFAPEAIPLAALTYWRRAKSSRAYANGFETITEVAGQPSMPWRCDVTVLYADHAMRWSITGRRDYWRLLRSHPAHIAEIARPSDRRWAHRSFSTLCDII
jgi:hypothetical protein